MKKLILLLGCGLGILDEYHKQISETCTERYYRFNVCKSFVWLLIFGVWMYVNYILVANYGGVFSRLNELPDNGMSGILFLTVLINCVVAFALGVCVLCMVVGWLEHMGFFDWAEGVYNKCVAFCDKMSEKTEFKG